MKPLNLEALTESAVAALLGVSDRMVRNYCTRNGLPHIGNGREKRFDWGRVLEWYLLYRVDVAVNGGRQRSCLRFKVRKIRNEAETAMRERTSKRYEQMLSRKRQQVKALEARVEAGRSPHRPTRPRAGR